MRKTSIAVDTDVHVSHGGNILCPLKMGVWKPSSQWDAIWRWGLGKQLGHAGRAPMSGISVHVK